jgi:hypothetical protein
VVMVAVAKKFCGQLFTERKTFLKTFYRAKKVF